MPAVQADVLPRHKLTVDDFHRMGEAGIFHEDDRLELIEGELIDMAPIGSQHAGVVIRLSRMLTLAVIDRAVVSVQNPLRLAPHSEPQPDIALLKARSDDYTGSLPEAADVLLIVEVSDTTVEYDRRIKLPLYARHGIPEVWLVDLKAGTLERHLDPSGERYQTCAVFERHQTLSPTLLPNVRLDLSTVF